MKGLQGWEAKTTKVPLGYVTPSALNPLVLLLTATSMSISSFRNL